MKERIAPSERKAQAVWALLQGQSEGQRGEELLSTLVHLSTERVVQEALEQEQAEGKRSSPGVLPSEQETSEKIDKRRASPGDRAHLLS